MKKIILASMMMIMIGIFSVMVSAEQINLHAVKDGSFQFISGAKGHSDFTTSAIVGTLTFSGKDNKRCDVNMMMSISNTNTTSTRSSVSVSGNAYGYYSINGTVYTLEPGKNGKYVYNKNSNTLSVYFGNKLVVSSLRVK